MATSGLIQTITAALTLFDDDIAFLLLTGGLGSNLSLAGYLAEVAVVQTSNRGINHANRPRIVPAYQSPKPS